MPPHETLAAASSRPNPEALAMRVVLAHPHTAFHPYMCGLRGCAAAFAATLIGYNDRGGCCRHDHKEEAIVINYFIHIDARQHWIAALTLLPLLSMSSGNDDL
jgi:hypothetical protein